MIRTHRTVTYAGEVWLDQGNLIGQRIQGGTLHILSVTKSNWASCDHCTHILVVRIAFLAFWWNGNTPGFETLVCSTCIVDVCVIKIKMGYDLPWLQKWPSLVYPWYQCAQECACQCLR
jgi:hypothetical protein